MAEINPFSLQVPDSVQEVDPGTSEYLREQAQFLRETHDKNQAGDTTFPVSLLAELTPTPLYNLGAEGKFYDGTYGVFKARYVRFESMDPTLPRGGPLGITPTSDIIWAVTNQLEKSTKGFILGMNFSTQVPPAGTYGWVVYSGTNLVPVETSTAIKKGDLVGWGAGGTYASGTESAIGVAMAKADGGMLGVGELWLDAGSRSADLSGILDRLEAIESTTVPTITEIDGLLQHVYTTFEAELTKNSAALDGKVSMLERKVLAVSDNSLLATMESYMDLTGFFKDQALAAANQVGIQVDASNSVLRKVEAIRDQAGVIVKSVTEMSNAAELANGIAGGHAASSLKYSQEALVGSNEAGNWASAAQESALAAEVSNANSLASANNSEVSRAFADQAKAQTQTLRDQTSAFAVTTQSLANRLWPATLAPVERDAYTIVGAPPIVGPQSTWPTPFLTQYPVNGAGQEFGSHFKEWRARPLMGRRIRLTAWVYTYATNNQWVVLRVLTGPSPIWDGNAIDPGGVDATDGVKQLFAFNGPALGVGSGFRKLCVDCVVDSTWRSYWSANLQVRTTGGLINESWHTSGILVEDVTDSFKSEAFAKNSEDSWTLADDAAAEAGFARDLAAQYRNQAEGFKNSSQTFAGNSEASKVLADQARANAYTARDLTATYRDQAEGFKNTASSQAGISNAQRVLAEAAAASALASSVLSARYGSGGGNLVFNSTLVVDTQDWQEYTSAPAAVDFGRDIPSLDWTPKNEHALGIHQTNGATGIAAQWHNKLRISIKKNVWYCFQVLAAAHRCNVGLKIEWYTAGGVFIREKYSNGAAVNTGGPDINNWTPRWVVDAAPDNAAECHVVMFKDPTLAGQSDSWAWFCQMQLREVPIDFTGPAVYSPSGPRALLEDFSGAIADAEGKMRAYWGVIASVPGQRASLSVYADNAGAGVDVTGDVRFRNASGSQNIDLINGQITFNNGSFMKVMGTGFGVSNEFVSWYGPTLAGLNLCSRSNAISYETVNGSAYFGGSLSAGIFKNAVQTTSLANNANIATGIVGSNGGTRTVVVSYYWSLNQVRSGPMSAGSGTISAVIHLYRNDVHWTTLNAGGTWQRETAYGPSEPAGYQESMFGSLTATDTSGGVSVSYAAYLVTRSLGAGGSGSVQSETVSQRLGIVQTE